MAKQVEIPVEFADLSGLRACWNQYISHGALMTSVYPPLEVGVSVVACVGLAGTSRLARLDGEILQSSTAATIVQLSPLSDDARIALAEMGLEEADSGGLRREAQTVAAPIEAVPSAPERPASGNDEGGGSAHSLLFQDKEETPATPRTRGAPVGSLEWAYHLSGKRLREREQELPEATRSGR